MKQSIVNKRDLIFLLRIQTATEKVNKLVKALSGSTISYDNETVVGKLYPIYELLQNVSPFNYSPEAQNDPDAMEFYRILDDTETSVDQKADILLNGENSDISVLNYQDMCQLLTIYQGILDLEQHITELIGDPGLDGSDGSILAELRCIDYVLCDTSPLFAYENRPNDTDFNIADTEHVQVLDSDLPIEEKAKRLLMIE